jgi:hypothetical protein
MPIISRTMRNPTRPQPFGRKVIFAGIAVYGGIDRALAIDWNRFCKGEERWMSSEAIGRRDVLKAMSVTAVGAACIAQTRNAHAQFAMPNSVGTEPPRREVQVDVE